MSRLSALRVTRRSPVPDAPAPGEVVARASGVGVALGGRPVLDGVDLEVRAGELLALVGPNGAGKSTLLGILAADLEADSGSVELFGRPLGSWSASDLALRRAVLPQSVSVSFPFTVREVVEMGRAPWRGTNAESLDASVVAESMRRADVHDLAERRFTELSGGERARVALARVLAQSVPLVLLDEPTASLDVRHQELVLAVARERAEAGDAVVVVLHDLALAAAYAHQVAILADATLLARGAPEQVLNPQLLSGVYQHDIEVIAHPRTGAPVVLPVREPTGSTAHRPTSPDGSGGAQYVHPKERETPMSSTSHDARTTSERFSEMLRSATTDDHEAAAVSTYMTELFEGKLSRDEYAEMVAQHYFAYLVLEEAAEAMRDDAVAGAFVIDALTRVPSLRADLAFLYGADWEDRIAPSTTTMEYCERMRAVCFDRPECFVAHHYTRYLGDLSGGQMIARVVRRVYELDAGSGAAFYEFDQIDDIPEFKAHYRRLLDEAAFDEATSQRMVDEVAVAYRLNTDVLAELDRDVTAARAAS